MALTMGYFFGAVVLMALIGLFKAMRFKEMFKIYVDGMKSMTDVAVTLVLAWSLGNGIITLLCYVVAGITRSPLTVVLAVAIQLAVIFVWNKVDLQIEK